MPSLESVHESPVVPATIFSQRNSTNNVKQTQFDDAKRVISMSISQYLILQIFFESLLDEKDEKF